MRTSCNGCRVLRKGCSEDCAIRPCLNWIKSPDAQANATVFLAKFYGRAGLLNLLNAGPDHLRPAIFQSLLYEACGRVVDPVYGSVGLLYSGQWHHCQVAVDSVLKGLPVMQLPHGTGVPPQQQPLLPPLQLFDIRHLSLSSGPSQTRTTRHRRTPRVPVSDSERISVNAGVGEGGDEHDDLGNHSMFSSGETSTDGSVAAGHVGESEPGLELTLGLFNKYG
ncbi:LOB domain-containing protein 41-like [Silene latifolia]|uniref:LOB domain-containing protein 41-like n=1 Tax=Silene latifolia TaxID=37657 RepID=UPI003D78037A